MELASKILIFNSLHLPDNRHCMSCTNYHHPSVRFALRQYYFIFPLKKIIYDENAFDMV